MQALVSRIAPTRLTSFAEKLKKVVLLLACDCPRQLCLVLCKCATVLELCNTHGCCQHSHTPANVLRYTAQTLSGTPSGLAESRRSSMAMLLTR